MALNCSTTLLLLSGVPHYDTVILRTSQSVLYLNSVTSYGHGRTYVVTKDVWNGWEAKRPLYMNAHRTNYKLSDTNFGVLPQSLEADTEQICSVG